MKVSDLGQAAHAVRADVVNVELDIDVVGGAPAADPATEVVATKHLHPQLPARCVGEAGPRDFRNRPRRHERIRGGTFDRLQDVR